MGLGVIAEEEDEGWEHAGEGEVTKGVHGEEKEGGGDDYSSDEFDDDGITDDSDEDNYSDDFNDSFDDESSGGSRTAGGANAGVLAARPRAVPDNRGGQPRSAPTRCPLNPCIRPLPPPPPPSRAALQASPDKELRALDRELGTIKLLRALTPLNQGGRTKSCFRPKSVLKSCLRNHDCLSVGGLATSR